MLSKGISRTKSPIKNEKRKKTIIIILIGFSVFFIAYGFYSFQKMRPEDGVKEELNQETGDRPLKKNIEIYVKADGGLSLRQDRNSGSERLILIPNKTKLEATEELDGWYKVTYQGKTGWISKQYTTIDEPAQDPYKDWSTFTGVGYTIKYPLGWKAKSYGAYTAGKASSLAAFSNQSLPDSIPSGTEFIAPVTIMVSTDTLDNVKKSYASISGVQSEAINVGGQPGTKYVYTSVSSDTQMTTVVLSSGSKVFVFAEAGGYQEDLLSMLKTFVVGG